MNTQPFNVQQEFNYLVPFVFSWVNSMLWAPDFERVVVVFSWSFPDGLGLGGLSLRFTASKPSVEINHYYHNRNDLDQWF